MANKKYIYPQLFPNGVVIGDPEFMDQYIKVTQVPEDYIVGELSDEIKNKGHMRSNEIDNPINTIFLKKYRDSKKPKEVPEVKVGETKIRRKFQRVKRRSMNEDEIIEQLLNN